MMISTKRKWLVWATVSIFYAYQYILRVVPSVLLPDISNKFHLSPEVFGQYSGVYYLGYSLMHLPIGAMLDRYGPKRILPVLILLTVLGSLPLVWADAWYYPIIGRVLVGIGSSAAILGVFKVIRSLFEPAHFSRMLSFSVTIGLLGAIYGGGPIHLLRAKFGYEQVVYFLLMGGIGLSIISYFFIPETPKSSKPFSASTVLEDMRAILSKPVVIILCLAAGLMVGPLEGFADVWGARFLKMVYGLEDSVAASVPSLIFLGMCFGGPLLNFIGEITKRFLHVILFSALVMAAGFAVLLSGMANIQGITVISIITGVCCAYQILAIDQIAKLVDSSQTGMATATANMIIMIFGYVFHGTIGKVISMTSVGTVDSALIDATSLVHGISVIPIALTVSMMALLWVIKTTQRQGSN